MKSKSRLLIGSAILCCGVLISPAMAGSFNIPGGELDAALDAYAAQSGVTVAISNDTIRGIHTNGVRGDLSPSDALNRLLKGTGFIARRDQSGILGIVRDTSSSLMVPDDLRLAQASPARASVETVTVTSSKLGGADVQSIPIAITALSQEQLTTTQTAGGPDLVKQVPNLTFTKTNFTGYSIQIRGIGTQAISVTTDPAVAVAFNDTPFIRNHFFEQEFYDVSQVEVLRGPQGTLYGRNATAGVVNVISAKPSDQFEAVASADIGNYKNRRFEGMINLPIVDDRLDIRVAGEWTKRAGYSFNELTNSSIDGRNLWSGRITVAFKPIQDLQMNLVWEHFQENDDRLRSSKQLCKKDPGPSEILGTSVIPITSAFNSAGSYLSQGCLPTSLYSADAFEVPNGYSLPFFLGLQQGGQVNSQDPYLSATQSRNLRTIESTLTPIYNAKNDTAELNAEYQLSPWLTLSSQTGYSRDFLYSTEDYNRFNTSPGIWAPENSLLRPGLLEPNGDFCDPQLGCSSRLVGEDLSMETSLQLSQEFRLASKMNGPLNFSIGANYLHYETDENYYVFINGITLLANAPYPVPWNFWLSPWIPNVSDNMEWLNGTQRPDPNSSVHQLLPVSYIDPNKLSDINGQGHNYFRSDNPYMLNSYAAFGEAYYNIFNDLKFTGGLRWTDDQKHFVRIPSEILISGYGYPIQGILDQGWSKVTGRLAADWTPKLEFTDQTLIFASFSHGYKAGGANPPGALLMSRNGVANPVHPLTFAPEYIDAFELGSKNTLLGGTLTLNGSAFYYDYKGYQISEIMDRTAINLNFDATVKGAELEATWEPTPGFKLAFAGGYESTRIANGSKAVDLMDRTAGRSDWVVVKPFPTQASNCVVPAYVAKYLMLDPGIGQYANISLVCGYAYAEGWDPATATAYVPNPTAHFDGSPLPPTYAGYPGFDPVDPNATNTYNGHNYGPPPNNGAGFDKGVSGNELPNAPPFTVSLSADYTLPLTSEWAGTLHMDYYWQDYSWARVFNDNPYDRLRGYTNVNLALILTGQNGWQVMGYLKNVFDTTQITGAFLNSDDSGLTTNVFLTDPRLFGVRVTKNW